MSLCRPLSAALHPSEQQLGAFVRFSPVPRASAMDPSPESQAGARSRRAERSPNTGSQATPPSYGYHNTFHTHETPILASPPSYAAANNPKTLNWLCSKARAEAQAVRTFKQPPPYTCTVENEGILGMKQELASVFEVSRSREWNDVYAILRGTQLTIYRLKSPGLLSKNRTPIPGRVLKTFTLQHAEVGVASDFKKTALTPKSPFAHLVPVSARQKLYETDPHLFEPVREHALRLRLETEQFLLCASTQEEMLTWVEKLCAAIDISSPLEDRSEPRYRSLPRRSRRQRVLDGSRIAGDIENLSNLEMGRRIIAEQEEIIRQLFPHLASSPAQESHESAHSPHAADPDREDFDPDDVRFPSRQPRNSSLNGTASNEGETHTDGRPLSSASDADPKNAPVARPSRSQALRYRRRCAPVLLTCSPRVSDVVFSGGRRMRINTKEHILVEYTSHPPRYDAHNFPKGKRTAKIEENTAGDTNDDQPQPTHTKPIPAAVSVERPASPLRGISDDSLAFGYDLASTSSENASDDIRSAAPSEPPSPTALTQAKADAARHLAAMGKNRRNSEENRENGLSAVALGVGLLI